MNEKLLFCAYFDPLEFLLLFFDIFDEFELFLFDLFGVFLKVLHLEGDVF